MILAIGASGWRARTVVECGGEQELRTTTTHPTESYLHPTESYLQRIVLPQGVLTAGARPIAARA